VAVQLNATLNGLSTKLINSAALTVLPTTGVTNNYASVVVSLNDPFTTPLLITNIQSNATSRGLFVGNIIQNTVFNAAGKTTTLSPALGFNLNLYPPDIFSLLRQLAVEAGLNPAQLDGIVQLGGYQYVPTTGPQGSRKRSVQDYDDMKDTPWSEYGAESLEDLLVAPIKTAVLPGQQYQDILASPNLDSEGDENVTEQAARAGFVFEETSRDDFSAFSNKDLADLLVSSSRSVILPGDDLAEHMTSPELHKRSTPLAKRANIYTGCVVSM
jgi:hypothetical protein